MSLPTGDVIGLMIDNLRIRGSVLPIAARSATKWAKGLDIPRGGKTVIYTGLMYQLLPYITASVRNLERFEDSFWGKFVFVARYFNKILNVSKFMGFPSKADLTEYNQILRNIALLLRQAGVEFGYLHERELYSGALAYDLGADDAFRLHASKVYERLKQDGVQSLITVDPHTTNMLRTVYPRFIDGYDMHVRSYLEVLVERNMPAARKADADVVIHDSCVYARYENVIEEPRTLLDRAGYRVKELRDSKEMTHCCGGPVESLYPKLANRIGKKRVQQLENAGAQNAALMCPICLATLKKAGRAKIQITDISNLLAEAYCDGQFN